MKSQFQNWSQSEPVDGSTLTKRWPADDRRIHCRPPAIDRSPNGHRWTSWRSSAGHRRGTCRKFGHLQRKSTGGRTVSRRRPSGACWLTLRHGSRSRKSGMSCRSRKIGIRQKSTGHRAIYFLGTSALACKIKNCLTVLMSCTDGVGGGDSASASILHTCYIR